MVFMRGDWELFEDLENYALLTTGVTHGIYDFDLDGKWIWETTRYNVVEFNEDGTKWLDEYTQEWFDTPSLSMGEEGLDALNKYYDKREHVRQIILNMDEHGIGVGQYAYSRINLCNYGSVTYRISETEIVSYGSYEGDASELLADYPDAVYWGEW